MLLLLSAKSDEYLLHIVGLRVKGDVSYISSWSDTSVKKLVDTSNILDMIVSFNSNFNGHDQQVSPSKAWKMSEVSAIDKIWHCPTNSYKKTDHSQDAQELLQTVFAMIARDTEKSRNRPVNRALSLGNIVGESPKRIFPQNPFEGWITR